jgi:cephalosporin hydroxylase
VKLGQKIKAFFRGAKQAPQQTRHCKPNGDQRDPKRKVLEQVRQLFEQEKALDALRLTRETIANEPAAPGLFFWQGRCLDRLGRHEEAIEAFAAELSVSPENQEARAWHDSLSKALSRPVTEKIPTAQRSWNTSLPRGTLLQIQHSLHNYHYKGVPLLKNPFDFALYPMLLWELKPRTILEIGSKSGGSGLWFADLLDSFGIDGRIYSLDIVKVENVSHPRLTFLEGDGRALEQSFTEEFLAALPRPWLVIEDADHVYETSIAVLRFFHPHLQTGDYIVIEDGIISDLEQDKTCNSGPHRALKEFLGERGGDYELDARYCDFFGYNLTWCTNGFLKKT